MHENEIDWFKEVLNIKEAKTDEWLTKSQWAPKLRTSPTKSKFAALWDQMAGSYIEHPDQPLIIDDHIVTGENRKSGGSASVFCVNSSEENWFKEKLDLNIEPKTGEWKSTVEFARLLAVRYEADDNYKKLWAQIKDAYDNSPDHTVTVNGHLVNCAYKKIEANGKKTFCIHQDEKGWFKKLLNPELGTKSDSYHAKHAFLKLVHVSDKNVAANELWQEIVKAHKADRNNVIVDGHRIDCVEQQAGAGKKYLGIQATEAEWYKYKLGKASTYKPEQSIISEGNKWRETSGRKKHLSLLIANIFEIVLAVRVQILRNNSLSNKARKRYGFEN